MSFNFGTTASGTAPGGTGGIKFGTGAGAGAKPTTASNPFANAGATSKPTSYAFSGGASGTTPALSFGTGSDKKAGLSLGTPSGDKTAPGGGFNMNIAAPKTGVPPPPAPSFGTGASSTTTAPAAGFGLTPAAEKKDSKPVIGFGAPPKGGDGSKPSFGTPSTTAAPKPPAGKTGFGFGVPPAGGDASKSGAPSTTVPTTTTAAPTTGAAKTGFGFGAGKEGTSVTPATTTPGTTASTIVPGVGTAVATTQDNPFSKMVLQEVITKWKAELEEDVLNYQKQAERVKKWDEQLRENQKVLNGLVDTVHRLYMDQDDLATNIQQISEFQDDLDRDLNELSEQVDKELEKMGDLQPDEALYTREQIYTRATDLDRHLTQMHTNLESIVTDFNEARGGEDSDRALEGTSDIGKILKVLNVHNDSLSFIESKSRKMQLDSDALVRQMENMYSNSSSNANGASATHYGYGGNRY